MVIFLALNEKFKDDVKPQSLSDFTENVESLMGDVPANQTVISKQFAVKEIKVKIRPFSAKIDDVIFHKSLFNRIVFFFLSFVKKLLQIRPEYSRNEYKNAIPHASNPNDTVLPCEFYPGCITVC